MWVKVTDRRFVNISDARQIHINHQFRRETNRQGEVSETTELIGAELIATFPGGKTETLFYASVEAAGGKDRAITAANTALAQINMTLNDGRGPLDLVVKDSSAAHLGVKDSPAAHLGPKDPSSPLVFAKPNSIAPKLTD